MITIKNNGDYFVKDSVLLPSQKDEFRHEDIAKNIINLIENEAPPFNIAIVGRWGIGKSSLISIIKRHFEKMPSKYAVEEINAWKYEKEALRRVFLKKILAKLGYKDKSSAKELSDNITSYMGHSQEAKMTFKDYLNEWLPLLGVALIIYVAGVALSLVGHTISSNINNIVLTKENWLNFVLGGFAQNFYLPIFVVLIQQFIKAASGKVKFQITTPIKSTDEYEDQLKRILDANGKTIITIVDDLDRLTPDKIVEALDAIKAFVNYENCIFIVPFDDTILKKALKNKTISFSKNEHLLIESELFLDKLFQYKTYLPNTIPSDLPQYAIVLVKSEAKDLFRLFDDELQFESLVKEVLIHKSVTTPRQVKKIINAFSHHMLLAIRREEARVTDNIFLCPTGIRILAKISVLQADFSDFYTKMFEQPKLIEEFFKVINGIKDEGNYKQTEIPHYLQPYFIAEQVEGNEVVSLSKSAENLYMFLSRTSNVTCDNYIPFLYMDYDSVSVTFGSGLSRDLRNALTSGAIEIVRNRLESNSEADLSELLYTILSNAEPFDYANCCEVLINLYSENGLRANQKLLDLIAKRVTAIYNSGGSLRANNIDFDMLCEFKKSVSETSGIENGIKEIILTKDKLISERLEYFFAHYKYFTSEVQNKVKSYVQKDLGSDDLTVSTFCAIGTLDIPNHFDPYLNSLNLLTKLADIIVEEGSYNSESNEISFFISLLEKHREKNNITDAIKSFIEKLVDEDLFLIIFDCISKAAEQVDEQTGSKLFSMFIEYKDADCRKKANELLTKLKWSIAAKAKESADKYFEEEMRDDNINDILMNVANRKQISYIPNTIKNINTTFIENSLGYDVMKTIQSQYTIVQKTEFISYIAGHISFAQNPNGQKFDVAGKTLDMLANDPANNELLNTLLISKLYADITRQANNAYATSAATLLPSLLPAIRDEQKQQFLTWCTTPSNINNYSSLTISMMDTFHHDLTNQHMTAVSTVMKLTSSELTSSILRLLRFVKGLFANDTAVLKEYIDYLLANISNDDTRKEIIADLDWFSSIGDIEEFLKTGVLYDDIEDDYIRLSIKFLQKIKNYDVVLDNVLHSIDHTNIKPIYSIIQAVRGDETPSFISSLIAKSSGDDSINYIFNLLAIKAIANPKFDDEIRILSVILFEQGDESVVNFTVDLLVELPVPSLTTQGKRDWGNILYDTFRKLSDNKAKQKTYQLVNRIGAKNNFLKDENKHSRDLSEDEKIIIKAR